MLSVDKCLCLGVFTIEAWYQSLSNNRWIWICYCLRLWRWLLIWLSLDRLFHRLRRLFKLTGLCFHVAWLHCQSLCLAIHCLLPGCLSRETCHLLTFCLRIWLCLRQAREQRLRLVLTALRPCCLNLAVRKCFYLGLHLGAGELPVFGLDFDRVALFRLHFRLDLGRFECLGVGLNFDWLGVEARAHCLDLDWLKMFGLRFRLNLHRLDFPNFSLHPSASKLLDVCLHIIGCIFFNFGLYFTSCILFDLCLGVSWLKLFVLGLWWSFF